MRKRWLVIAFAVIALPIAGLASQRAGTFGSPAARPAATAPPHAGHRPARSWLAPNTGFQKPLLYVVEDSAVVIYPGRGRNPQKIGEISQSKESAYDAYVDRHGNLYVVNWEGNVPGVSVYPPGATQPALTISKGLQRPLFAIVDHRGHLFVSDGNTGQVVEYRPGQNVPERILATHGFEADGMAFDEQGNLYVAYRSGSHADSVDVFPGGRNPPRDLGLNLSDPQGIVVDGAGNLIVAETLGSDSVDVFPPGQTHPSQVWSVQGVPTGLAFDRRSRALFVSCLDGSVLRIVYPGGRAPVTQLSTDQNLQGMAFSPVAHF